MLRIIRTILGFTPYSNIYIYFARPARCAAMSEHGPGLDRQEIIVIELLKFNAAAEIETGSVAAA